jgi:hypothetical protein
MKTVVSALVTLLLGCSGWAHAQARIFPSPNAQRGPLIAVNPTNAKNLVGVAITSDPSKIGAYYSSDGGEGWDGTDNISGTGSASDPALAFDPDGIAYVIYKGTYPDPGVYLRKSTDGGVS